MESLQDETKEMILSNEDGMQRILDDVKLGHIPSDKLKAGIISGEEPLSKLDRARAALQESKRQVEKDMEEEDDEQPKKKAKKGKAKSATDEIKVDPSILTVDDRIRGDTLAIYEKKNIDELKDYLRWNRQILKGTKSILLMKCIDGHIYGRLGRCPVCIEGKLELSQKNEGDTVDCNGYFDTESNSRMSCSFSCKNSDAPRLKWFIEKPTEEENETMDREDNKVAATATDVASNMAKSLGVFTEFDLYSKAGIKAATVRYVDLCREFNLDIPEDTSDAARSVGPLLISDRSLPPEEFCKVLCDKFGIKKSDEEENQRMEVISSVCKCHANGKIYSLMVELSKLYSAEGNGNAANTYVKVANAVKELDFEITTENVMGLSKGKTKVSGIGKGSADKIKEFLTTGKIEKLEEKRAARK